MSFVDITTLTMYKRNELDSRINIFNENCDQAINDIKKLKSRARQFAHQLDCDLSEFKDRFLNCMRQLDEYMYILTDFNLAMEQFEDPTNLDNTPVQDTKTMPCLAPQQIGQMNLIDALSEPSASTSAACSNFCPPIRQKRIKVPKAQELISFSNTSSSSESVPLGDNVKVSKEVQCEVANDFNNMKIEDATSPVQLDVCNLPPQTVLEVDHKYPATIMHVDGINIWLITDECCELLKLMKDMNQYYENNYVNLGIERVRALTTCAFFDIDNNVYHRGLFIDLIENANAASVFAVDTGEIRSVALEYLQPIPAQFCVRPPFARCCHLAGVEFLDQNNEEIVKRQEEFLMQHIQATLCSIEVDDNTSESLGVILTLPSNEILNDLVIQSGLAAPIDRTADVARSGTPMQGPPEMVDSELDMADCPEYEDPVMAVTGYHNRDEADICKHYKGGPEKTCFKGTRCTKKHINKHPDGWTLDKVEVSCQLSTAALPPPGSWRRLLVTTVCHFDRFYAQIQPEKPKREKLPEFGEVLPPTTLNALVRDMNSPATRLAYKPLTIAPAPGELVAVPYPMDNNWYRACVQTLTRADQNVQVMYVDYGTVLWVHEGELRALPARLAALPAQAVLCRLAGVRPASHLSHQWAAAKKQLADLILNKALEARIIAREYDELVVELLDDEGYNVSEQLAAQELVYLEPYAVVDDTKVTQKHVVP